MKVLKSKLPKKVSKKYDEDIEKLKSKIEELNTQLSELNKAQLLDDLEELPFDEGDDVMCEVPAGKTRKVTRCVLEIGNDGSFWGFYVRPYKNDGELSNRRFCMNPKNCMPVED